MHPGQNVPSNVSLTQDTGGFFDRVGNPVPEVWDENAFQTYAACHKIGSNSLHSAQSVIFLSYCQ